MEYVQMTLNDWMSIKGELESELRNAAAGFVRIGYLLRKIDEQEGYKQDGYNSIAEWAKDKYGMSPTQVSRFMAINRRYSIDGYSKQLKTEYANYGQSKLVEMLALPEEAMDMVSPDMKRSDIREIKAFERQAPNEEPAQETGSIPQWIIEFVKENPFRTDTKAFENNDIQAMAEEVNPTGTKTFRHKRTLASMFADRIMVREFPNPAERMEWSDFFDMAIPELARQQAVTESVTPEEEYKDYVTDQKEDEQITADSEHFTADSEHFTAESEHFTAESEQTTTKSEQITTESEQIIEEPEKEKEEEPAEQIAPAQKSEPDIVDNNVKTDFEEDEKEPEQVEIEEIMPAPTEPDPMRDLKDRFAAEINSLKILLDCENFGGMKQTIERLEQLRERMSTLKFMQG